MPFAVIAGVGAGTGRSVALKVIRMCLSIWLPLLCWCEGTKFAKAYPIALLARNPDNYKDIVEEINSSGGKAIGISTDVSDSVSVKAAFKQIEQELGGSCSAAIFNASGGFRRAPFLDTDENTFVNAMSVSWWVHQPSRDLVSNQMTYNDDQLWGFPFLTAKPAVLAQSN